MSHENNIVRAVKLLETTGAGLTNIELEYVKNHIPDVQEVRFQQAIDRNEGLIAVSRQGIEETRHLENARVTIDLAARTVKLQTFLYHGPKEEYEDKCDPVSEYPIYEDIDFENIPFDKFAEISNFINDLIDENIYGFLTPKGDLYRFIE